MSIGVSLIISTMIVKKDEAYRNRSVSDVLYELDNIMIGARAACLICWKIRSALVCSIFKVLTCFGVF